MKKLLTRVIATIILLLAATPPLLGLWFKFSEPTLFAHSPFRHDLQVKQTAFHFGWFHSSANFDVYRISNKQKPVFTLHSEIDQLPIMNKNPKLTLLHVYTTSPNHDFHLITSINFIGKLKQTLTFPSFQLQQNNVKLALNGVSAIFETSVFNKQWHGQVSIESGALHAQSISATLQQADFTGNALQNGHLYFGERNLNVKTLSLTSGNEKLLIQGLHAKSHARSKADLTRLTYHIEAMDIESRHHYAHNLKTTLTLGQLKTDLLNNILADEDENKAQGGNQPSTQDFSSAMLTLLSAGATLRVNPLEMETEHGKVSVNISLSLPLNEHSTSLSTFIQNLYGDVQLTASKTWVLHTLIEFYQRYANKAYRKDAKEIAALQIKHWIIHGLLHPSGDTLTLRLKMQHAHITTG